MTEEASLWKVEITGEYYKEGSADPWRGGSASAVVEAEGNIPAVIEVLEGLGNHGKIVTEGGDCDWLVFEDERELTIRVSPVPTGFPLSDDAR